MARHKLVRMHPARLALYACQPVANAGILVPGDANLVGPEKIAAKRQVGDGEPIADDIAAAGEMRIEHAPGCLRAPAKESDHRRLRVFDECAHEAQRRGEARQFMVVPKQPAQDLAALDGFRGAEPTERLREVVENHARLREAHAAVLEHRCLAHDVDVAVGAAAGLAAEVVDEARRPVSAAKLQRKRAFIRVTGLRKTIEGELTRLRARFRARSGGRGAARLVHVAYLGGHLTILPWPASARPDRTCPRPRTA